MQKTNRGRERGVHNLELFSALDQQTIAFHFSFVVGLKTIDLAQVLAMLFDPVSQALLVLVNR